MATALHDTGEEFLLDSVFRRDTLTFPDNLTVGLHTDDDAFDKESDIGDIESTEPDGSEYSRQAVNFDSSDFSVENNNDNWEVSITDVTFNTEDSSQDVDAYFVVVHFESEDKNDTETNDHLFWTGELDQSYNLSDISQFTLQNSGISIS